MAGPQRFYRIPLAVDAVQFDGRNFEDLDVWITPGFFDFDEQAAPGDDAHIAVLSKEGGKWLPVHAGDWVLLWADDRYKVVSTEELLDDFKPGGGA